MNRIQSWCRRQWEDNGWFSCIVPCLTAVACCLCVVIFDKSKEMNNTLICLGMLAAVSAAAAIRRLSGRRISVQGVILLLFVIGFILRLNYVLYTTIDLFSVERQHDMGGLAITTTTGHEAYINWFYNNGLKAWDPTVGQFYQPPLHYMLAALWLRILTLCGLGYERVVVSLQYLTLFYSSCCMIVTERMLTALNVRGGGKITAFAIVVFHPTLFLLAGSGNNDMLTVLFTLLSIYTSIRWYQKPSVRRILPVAFSIGLGMMTKLSAAVVAVPIAFLFFARFIEGSETNEATGGARRGSAAAWIAWIRERLPLVGQFIAFGCVSFPLGLWYPVWKYVKYDVPLTWVARMSNEYLQYIGDYSAWQRFFDFSNHPFARVFETWGEEAEYNILAALCKTSVFGETAFAEEGTPMMFLCRMLLWVNIFLILVSVLSLVYCVRKKDPFFDGALKAFVVLVEVVTFAYYIYFCLDYPHTCSMDYRYIAFSFIPMACMVGMLMNRVKLPEEKEKTAGIIFGRNDAAESTGSGEDIHRNLGWNAGRAGRLLYAADELLTAAFCVLSMIVYIYLGT